MYDDKKIWEVILVVARTDKKNLAYIKALQPTKKATLIRDVWREIGHKIQDTIQGITTN